MIKLNVSLLGIRQSNFKRPSFACSLLFVGYVCYLAQGKNVSKRFAAINRKKGSSLCGKNPPQFSVVICVVVETHISANRYLNHQSKTLAQKHSKRTRLPKVLESCRAKSSHAPTKDALAIYWCSWNAITREM